MTKQVTVPQLTELHELIKCKKINRENLQTFLRSVQATEMKKDLETPSLNTPVEFKVWKTIRLGTLKNADDFRAALKANGNEIGGYANDILGKVTVATEETEVKLVVVSARDLGFKENPTRKEVYDRALSIGLELCSSEVGPQLRLQYTSQPKGDGLSIGMEPITDSDNVPFMFEVECSDDGESWLGAYYYDSCHECYADHLWVFVRRN